MPLSKIVQDSINGGVAGSGPAFRGALATNLTVSNSTNTKVSFNTKQFDTSSAYSSGTFIAPISGYYQVNAFIAWSGDISGAWMFWWAKNGSMVYSNAFLVSTASATGTNHGLGGSDLIYLAANDTLEGYVWQGSGSTKYVTSGGETFASIVLVRAA